jgi:hypothetical protein
MIRVVLDHPPGLRDDFVLLHVLSDSIRPLDLPSRPANSSDRPQEHLLVAQVQVEVDVMQPLSLITRHLLENVFEERIDDKVRLDQLPVLLYNRVLELGTGLPALEKQRNGREDDAKRRRPGSSIDERGEGEHVVNLGEPGACRHS